MRGRASSALRRFALPAGCVLLCISLANCANNSHIDPRYGVEPSARLVEPGAPVPKGGGSLPGRFALRGGRPRLCPAGQPALSGRRGRLLVRLRFSWPRDREWRNLRRRRHHRRASDPAVAELCARVELEQRSLADRSRQRSRALCRQSHHRRFQARRPPVGLYSERDRLGARGICRSRSGGRLRRSAAGSDAAPGRTGAGTGRCQTRRHQDRARFNDHAAIPNAARQHHNDRLIAAECHADLCSRNHVGRQAIPENSSPGAAFTDLDVIAC